jgi:hypothetical protein
MNGSFFGKWWSSFSERCRDLFNGAKVVFQLANFSCLHIYILWRGKNGMETWKKCESNKDIRIHACINIFIISWLSQCLFTSGSCLVCWPRSVLIWLQQPERKWQDEVKSAGARDTRKFCRKLLFNSPPLLLCDSTHAPCVISINSPSCVYSGRGQWFLACVPSTCFYSPHELDLFPGVGGQLYIASSYISIWFPFTVYIMVRVHKESLLYIVVYEDSLMAL